VLDQGWKNIFVYEPYQKILGNIEPHLSTNKMTKLHFNMKSQKFELENTTQRTKDLSGSNFVHASVRIYLDATTRCQFHQRSIYSFYTWRSQKHKKYSLSRQNTFTLSGSAGTEAECRTLMKLVWFWFWFWFIFDLDK